jgi:hypothetical protein
MAGPGHRRFSVAVSKRRLRRACTAGESADPHNCGRVIAPYGHHPLHRVDASAEKGAPPGATIAIASGQN